MNNKKSMESELCCGQHLDCEKGLRILRDESLYYNDEELDAYKGIAPEDFTPEQAAEIREVFETLMPKIIQIHGIFKGSSFYKNM